nr:hypothetical protein HmN_000325400 [Hymenolepis microstoma]
MLPGVEWTESKAVIQNEDETMQAAAVISSQKSRLCSSPKLPWSRNDLGLVLTSPRNFPSYPVDPYLKCSQIISINSATTGTIINSLRRVIPNQKVLKYLLSLYVAVFSKTKKDQTELCPIACDLLRSFGDPEQSSLIPTPLRTLQQTSEMIQVRSNTEICEETAFARWCSTKK